MVGIAIILGYCLIAGLSAPEWKHSIAGTILVLAGFFVFGFLALGVAFGEPRTSLWSGFASASEVTKYWLLGLAISAVVGGAIALIMTLVGY